VGFCLGLPRELNLVFSSQPPSGLQRRPLLKFIKIFKNKKIGQDAGFKNALRFVTTAPHSGHSPRPACAGGGTP